MFFNCSYCGVSLYKAQIKKHIMFCAGPVAGTTAWQDILSRKNRYVWKKSLGNEADRIDNWKTLVMTGMLPIDDILFDPPRKPNESKPSSRKKMSVDRAGSKNPSIKDKISYSTTDIDLEICSSWVAWTQDFSLFCGIKHFLAGIEKTYPMWAYSYADRHAGFTDSQKKIEIISAATGICAKDIKKQLSMFRGAKISAGQDNDVTKAKMAAAAAATLKKRAPTKPQLKMTDMLRAYDAKIIPEYCVFTKSGMRSFDVYSKKYKTVFEMHGRVWHDPAKTTDTLLHIATKNELNDNFKKTVAAEKGLTYFVLWDDEQEQWETKLNDYFKDKEREITGSASCI